MENLSRTLEIDKWGNLLSILSYEDEVSIKIVTGVTELKELLILE